MPLARLWELRKSSAWRRPGPGRSPSDAVSFYLFGRLPSEASEPICEARRCSPPRPPLQTRSRKKHTGLDISGPRLAAAPPWCFSQMHFLAGLEPPAADFPSAILLQAAFSSLRSQKGL